MAAFPGQFSHQPMGALFPAQVCAHLQTAGSSQLQMAMTAFMFSSSSLIQKVLARSSTQWGRAGPSSTRLLLGQRAGASSWAQGWASLLYTNAWAMNFPLWSLDVDMRFRFRLQVLSPSGPPGPSLN